MRDSHSIERWSITIQGIVQGVGFRPFIYATARAHALSGWVLNDTGVVRIEVQGWADSIAGFLTAIKEQAPPQSRIERIETVQLRGRFFPPHESSEFQILASRAESKPRPAIPADLATCAKCLAEIGDPAERRFRYPFTNCTNCGPRWSIVTQLPYDRARTSMSSFTMCPDCRKEYETPAYRRFHAQPIACPICGPHLVLLDTHGQLLAERDAALAAAIRAVRDGNILALKGLGGFQLIVDATNAAAVERLRARKCRPDKPLAVMLADVPSVRRYCSVSNAAAECMTSAQAPILLLRRIESRDAKNAIAESVAPDTPYLGVMLPYTPLHHLLAAELGRPMICTSGNRSEEPMAIRTADALLSLRDIADIVLTHNRPIARPVDDSVARMDGSSLQLLRRARGYAPMPIRLACRVPRIVGVGGHLKNTVALAMGADVLLSPHIGDLDNLASVQVHRKAIDDLVRFFEVTPELLACDQHPDYRSTMHAEKLARQWNVPLLRIQHHHAHVLSVIAERHLAGPVLGFAWDGTGYGLDGAVWGGEALLCEGATFERIARLRYFALPGGDMAARQPRRSALGLLYDLLGTACDRMAATWFTATELAMLVPALARPRLFPQCGSVGRLFDAVAALCGLPATVSFEGQAAMALEFIAAEREAGTYPLELDESGPIIMDWRPMIRQILTDREQAVPVEIIAARFHETLAVAARQVAQRVGCPRIALSGGCFQNATLTARVRRRLSDAGFDVYTQQQVPPGDGGIALGQVLGAALRVGE